MEEETEEHTLLLLRAAWNGEVGELRQLLEGPVSFAHLVNSRGQAGVDTPLLLAAYRGHSEAVALLLDHHADVKKTGRQGDTALICAVGKGHWQTTKLLLERGADPSIANDVGGNALMYAACGGSANIIRALLKDGRCPVDEVCHQQQTALWSACYNGHLEAARVLLLEGGADHRVADLDGKTAMDIAREKGHRQCVELLQWFEEELQRAALLTKARQVVDDREAINQAPNKARACTAADAFNCRVEAAPAYLRARVRRGVALPSIEIGKEADEDAAQKKRVRAKEKAAASPGQQAEEDEVRRAVLSHVVRDLKCDPFSVLLDMLRHRVDMWPPSQ